MTDTIEKPITAKLDALRAAASEAARLVDLRGRQRKAAPAELAAVEAQIEDHLRSLGGRDPEPGHLDELRAEASEMRQRLKGREVTAAAPGSERGEYQVFAIEWVDPEAEAMYSGAVDAHREASARVDRFERDNVDGLLAERVPALAAARDRFVAAVCELAAAERVLGGHATWVAELGDRTGAWPEGAVPDHPLELDSSRGVAAAAAAVRTDPDRALMVPAALGTP